MGRIRINLASTRLAFFLIALVVLQILVTAVVPQKGLVAEQIIGMQSLLGEDNAVVRVLRLDRIFFSPLFLVSLSLLMVNLVAGNLRRFRTVLRVEGTLLKARHLGSIVFHLALLMITCGVMLHSLYRFDGWFGLTEGQRVQDVENQYFYITKGALSRDPGGRFSLTLVDIDRDYPVKDATTEAARILLEPSSGESSLEGLARINRPFLWEGYEFHYGALTGYSPEVLVLGPSGETIFRGFVRLKATKSGSEWIHADFVELPGSDIRVEVHITEGFGSDAEPGRLLEVTRAEATLFSGEISAADTVSVGEIRVAVPRVRTWCYLHAVRNPWLWLVFTGFWFALAGLTITVLPRVFPKKERGS